MSTNVKTIREPERKEGKGMAFRSLTRRLTQKNFQPQHVAEVGVYLPETSNILDYILMGVRTTLVEPLPVAVQRIKERFCQLDNVTLHEVAVFDRQGTVELIVKDASTFVDCVTGAPAVVNDGYSGETATKISVPAITFNQIDDGSIDLLSVDTEGCEWYVLQNLISRPAVIILETHGGRYVNPYIKQIRNWMRENGYQIWMKTDSDTVFVKPERIPIVWYERLQWKSKEVRLTVKRIRKQLKRLLF